MSRAERRALVERADPALPVTQQCRLLAVSRASVYRRPAEVSDADRAVLALIDRQYLGPDPTMARAGWRRGWRRRGTGSTASGSNG
jgi:hypothetical protein